MRLTDFATTLRSVALLVALSLLQPSLALARPADDGGRGTGGIPAVLAKLEQIERRLEQNAAQVEEIRAQVQTLDANLTPCTLERFQAGLCGPDNHPLDMMVSVCAGVGADAGLFLR